MEKGEKFKLNNGEYAVVVVDDGWNNVTVRLKRGNTKVTSRSALMRGTVYDPMKPSLCGVGYMGVGDFKSKNKDGSHTPEYSHWHDMICRCYNEKRLEKFPTYIGCSVHSDWHNFQVFSKWFVENYVEGMELDKDIKIKGNKVYSEDSCLFVSRFSNNEQATAKVFSFVSPLGEVINFLNLSEFCRANGLVVSCMSQVAAGVRTHHKGWKRPR